MRLVLLFTTATLLVVSGQIQVKKQKLHSCDLTVYQDTAYKKDNLKGENVHVPADTFEACCEKCLSRSDCKAVNYLLKEKECSLHGSGLTSEFADTNLYVEYPAVHAVINSCNPKPSGPVGCGTQAAAYKPLINKNLRIIGGIEAKPHSWPWLLSTSIETARYGNLVKSKDCGSVLLRVKDGIEKSDIVVTAAHCVTKQETSATGPQAFPANKVTITAGDHHLEKYEDGELKRIGAELRFHPKYLKVPSTVNDVAIIKLAIPLDFTDTIRPICLPKAGEAIPTDKTCMAAGWGRNNSKDENQSAETLQQVVAPAQDAKTCLKGWGSTYKEETQICAGNTAGKSGTCQGDSGGMLACQQNDGSWKLYGVTSFGVGDGSCLAPGQPAVFTRLSSYIDWITKNMNEMTTIK